MRRVGAGTVKKTEPTAQLEMGIADLEKENQQLKEEIQKLKGHTERKKPVK